MSLQFTQTSLWYYCKRQLQWNLVSTSCLWWLPYIISRPSKQNLFYLKVSDLVEENLQRDAEEWYEELSNNTKAYVKTEHVEIEAIKRDWEATSRRITITLVSFEYNQSINQFISFNYSFYNYSSSECFTLLYSIFMTNPSHGSRRFQGNVVFHPLLGTHLEGRLFSDLGHAGRDTVV